MIKLILYVNDHSSLSQKAVNNILALLEKEFKEQYSLEVIDVLDNPESAIEKNIIATPTIVKMEPKPEKRIIGELSDPKKVKDKLGLQ